MNTWTLALCNGSMLIITERKLPEDLRKVI